jgi:transcription termination factor Rho
VKTEASAPEATTEAMPAAEVKKEMFQQPRRKRKPRLQPQRSRKEVHEGPREGQPEVEGILENAEGGFGFFDSIIPDQRQGVYVSPSQIRRFNLKTGDKIKESQEGPMKARNSELLYVNTVNGDEAGVAIRRPDFDDLTPIFQIREYPWKRSDGAFHAFDRFLWRPSEKDRED